METVYHYLHIKKKFNHKISSENNKDSKVALKKKEFNSSVKCTRDSLIRI